jgi:hypothetical protein
MTKLPFRAGLLEVSLLATALQREHTISVLAADRSPAPARKASSFIVSATRSMSCVPCAHRAKRHLHAANPSAR